MPTALLLTFWVAVIATAASAICHALTFMDRTPHAALLLLPLLLLVWLGVVAQWRRVPRRNLVSEIFGDIPRWMKIASAALLIFAFANHFVCRSLNRSAKPDRLPDGRNVLVDPRGAVVAELSAADFRHAQAVQSRQLTGTLLACFGTAALLARACWIKNGPAMANRRL